MYIYLFLIFNERFILCATNRTTTTKTAKPSSFSLFFFGCLFFFFFLNQVSLTHILGYLNLCMFPEFFLIFSFPLILFFFSCYSFPSSCFHIASLFCSISSYFSTSLWRNITFFALLSQNFHEALCQVSLNYVGQIALV